MRSLVMPVVVFVSLFFFFFQQKKMRTLINDESYVDDKRELKQETFLSHGPPPEVSCFPI